MNKLFIFQNHVNNDYSDELKCGYDVISNTHISNLDIKELSADYLINYNVDVVISNGLQKEWYLILKGLKIVSITIDALSKYNDLSDIIIDYKSDKSNQYFTGIEYSLSANKDFEGEFDDIINLIKKLPWDSSFWKLPVSFLSCKHLTESIIFRINKFIKSENIRLIEYLCNCHDRRSVRIAEQNGFHFTDIRLSFEKKLEANLSVKLDDNIKFGVAKRNDIKILKGIATTLYLDSRYFFDENFERKKVKDFYKSWVEKAVLGQFDDECYCLYNKNIPIGFCTVKYIASNTANIGLVGFSRLYQGKGLGKKLLNLVFNNLKGKNISKVYVVTQGRNYAAQRLYQNVGFITKTTELWYHKWMLI